MDTNLQPMMDLMPDRQFGKNGRALSKEELKEVARRKGLCEVCGVVKTHSSGSSSSKLLAAVRRKQPITDDDAWQGVCIRCHRQRVPTEIAAAWEQRNKEHMVAAAAVSSLERAHKPASVPRSMPSSAQSQAQYLSPQSRKQLLSGPNTRLGSGGEGRSPGKRSPASMDSPVRRAAVLAANKAVSVPPLTIHSEKAKQERRRLMLSGTSVRFGSERESSVMASETKSTQILNNSTMSSEAGTDSSSELPIEYDPLKILEECSQYNEDTLRQALTDIRDSIHADGHAVLPSNALVQRIKEAADRHRQQTSIVAAASGAIWSISASVPTADNDPKEWIVHSGMIRTLIGILNTFCDTVNAQTLTEDQALFLEWGFGALTSIAQSSDRNCTRKLAIAQAGGIEAVLNTLEQYSSKASVVEWSCRCLYNLVYSYDELDDSADCESNGLVDNEIQRNVSTLTEAGGIQIILSSMKSHINESVVLLWAMKLLWILQGRSEEEARRNCRRLVEGGFFSLAVKVLRARSTSPDLFQVTSELMCMVLQSQLVKDLSVSCTGFDSTLSECIPSVVRLIGEERNDSCMLESGCRLLSSLCSVCDVLNRVQSDLQEFGAVSAIIDVMEKLSDNAAVFEVGSWAIWKCSSKPSFLDASHVRRAIRVMATAASTLEQGNFARIFLLSVCGVTTNCCDLLGNEELDRVVEASLGIFRSQSHSEDKELCEHALRALAQICASFPESARHISLSLDYQCLLRICDEPPSMKGDLFTVLVSVLTNTDSAVHKSSVLISWMLDAANASLSKTADNLEIANALDLIASLEAPGDPHDATLPDGLMRIICDYTKSQEVQPDIRVKSLSALFSLVRLTNLSSVHVQELVSNLKGVVDFPSSCDQLESEVCHLFWVMAAECHECTSRVVLESMFAAVLKVLKKHCSPEAAFQPEILGSAACALASITDNVKRNQIHADYEGVGVIAESAYKVLENESDGAHVILNFLIAIRNLCSVGKKGLVQSGAVVFVVDALAEHPENELIQQVGCSILSALSSTGSMLVCLVIVETEGIDAIAEAMKNFAHSLTIQREACKALSNFSISPELRALVLSQNGISLTAMALKTHFENKSLVLTACSTLCNLLLDTDGRISSEVGVVDAVLQAMSRFDSSVVVQGKCIDVLREIAVECFTMKEQSEVARRLLLCMERFMGTPSIAEPALIVLGKIAPSPCNQVIIVEAQDVVLNAMLTVMDSETALVAGCAFLASHSSLPDTRLLFLNSGMVDTIVLTMRAHFDSQALQAVACQALAIATTPCDDEGEPFVVRGDEMNAVASAMQRFPDCEFLQEQGCVVLCNFLASPKNAEVFKSNEAELKSVLNKAVASFPAGCSERAELVLTSFS